MTEREESVNKILESLLMIEPYRDAKNKSEAYWRGLSDSKNPKEDRRKKGL